MICYAFPLSDEAGQLLRSCTQRESFSIGTLRCTVANLGDRRILAAQIGMGRELAAKNTRLIFEHFRPRAFVLAGYGGALVPQLKVGQILVASNYSSPQALEWTQKISGFELARFCVTDEVIDTTEKREAHARALNSEVVEMEADAVTEVAASHDVPYLAVRSISDDYYHVLPMQAMLSAFDVKTGRSTPLRLLAYLAAHPGDFFPFRKLVADLFVARRTLTSFLRRLNDVLPRE